MTLNESLQLLQKVLILEHEDVYLYLRESALYQKKLVGGHNLARLFTDYGLSEMRHADLMAMAIGQLGGAPQWNIKPPHASESIRETLSVHIAREEQAISIYRRLIEIAGDHPNLQTVYRDILHEEELHLSHIENILQHLQNSAASKR
jgi:bacterioferritin (cytochrome b1)